MIDILRVRAITASIALLTVAAPTIGSASAQTMLVISGAGFGHGVGMSQWGAYGFARHGFDYRAILAHYYSDTSIGSAPSGARVRVLLQADRRSISFIGGNTIGRHHLAATTLYRATAAGRGRIALRGTSPKPLVLPAPLTIVTAAPFTLRGRAMNGVRDGRYRGALVLSIAPSGALDAIDSVGLEDYVRGVVADEADPSWPQPALQAQAVASRTYAITTSRSASRGFDQYADSRSQQYGGAGAETAASDAAVSSTSGQVVVYAGKPAVTYFFDSSGGMTENIENVFVGSNPEPWLRAVPDPYDDAAPRHAWGPLRFTLADAQRRLAGLVKGTFQGIDVTRRGASPRVMAADVVGSGGRTSVSGPELQSRLGLFDTWAFFAVTPDGTVPPGFGQLPGPGNNPSPGASGGTAADVGGASSGTAAVAGGVAAN